MSARRAAAQTAGWRCGFCAASGLLAVLPADHGLAGRKRVALSELAGEAFVVHPSGHRSSMHERVMAACAQAGFRPPVVEVAETATLVVCAAGLGVALVPEPVRSLGLAGVAYVSLSMAPTVEQAMASREGESSPAIAKVAAIIERCVAG